MSLITVFLILTTMLFILLGLAVQGTINNPKEKELWQLALSGPSRNKLPSTEVLKRVFSLDDLEFVAAEQCKPLRTLFVKERRKIAIVWLNLLKAEIGSLVREHRKFVRTNLQFQPKTEFFLALCLLQFAAMYLFVSTMLRFPGPFLAKQVTLQLQHITERLSDLQNDIQLQTLGTAAAR